MDLQVAEAAIPATCQNCNVRQSGICAVLTGKELNKLSGQSRHTCHSPGEPLAVESDEATCYANIIDGVVKLSRVLQDGREISVLHPEKRLYTVQQSVMTEAGIKPGVLGDVYVAIGEPLGNDAWALRGYWNAGCW